MTAATIPLRGERAQHFGQQSARSQPAGDLARFLAFTPSARSIHCFCHTDFTPPPPRSITRCTIGHHDAAAIR